MWSNVITPLLYVIAPQVLRYAPVSTCASNIGLSSHMGHVGVSSELLVLRTLSSTVRLTGWV